MITGLISTVTSVSKVYDRITGSNTYSEGLKTLKIDDATVQLAKAGGNMVNFMKKHIVEPVIVVTKNSYNRKDIDTILNFSTDAYLAFYVMTFKILINIHKLTFNQALSVMASKGFEVEEFVESHAALIDLESLDSLPLDIESTMRSTRSITTLESNEFQDVKTIVRTVDIKLDGSIEIELTNNVHGDKKHKENTSINIPIVVKANVMVVDAETIANSVEHRSSSVSFFKRLTQHRVGLVSLKDFLFASDLVAKYKEGVLTKDNFAGTINDNSRNHMNLETLLDKKVGLNKMVFTYILTDSELEMLGKRMGYNISKPKDKDKMMNALLAFNITGINEDRDMASIYINGINGSSMSSISKLSKGSSGKSTDSIEMLATALMSSRPF